MGELGTLYINHVDKEEPFEVGVSILHGEVASIAHYGVVRDYTITLETGEYIVIPAKTVRAIVDHENEEMGVQDGHTG